MVRKLSILFEQGGFSGTNYLGPMGSSKLSAGFDAVDKVENTLQRADSVATGVVRGDVGSMVTAAQAGSKAYKKSRRK